MKFEEAFEVLKTGEKVSREGRIFILRRGILDVTDPEEIKQYHLSETDQAAEDWEIFAEPEPEAIPETVPPEAVDEALAETELDHRDGDDHGVPDLDDETNE